MNIILYILLLIIPPDETYRTGLKFRPEPIDTSYEYCISVIKKYEVFKPKPYILFNYRYIGYGSMTKLDSITEKQADSLLRHEFNNNLRFVMLKGRFLSHKKQLALSMISFNIGCVKTLKSGLYANDSTFKEQYVKYSFINGKLHNKLKQRRIEEIKIYKN